MARVSGPIKPKQSLIIFDTQLKISLSNDNFLDLESLSDFDHDHRNREIDPDN